MLTCPQLPYPKITREQWDAMTPTEQAAFTDSYAIQWAAQYARCKEAHDALINHRKELGQ